MGIRARYDEQAEAAGRSARRSARLIANGAELPCPGNNPPTGKRAA